ncbi:hypothetical protein ZWY2020_025597 [Hordeum vulgare]|nr:hypothetical protein ZWY2020_025597 [Hordeum vulgare]
MFRRHSSDPVGIRVHEVIIRGNAKTREELIEAEVADLIRSTTTVQDLLSAAAEASARLRGLDVFEVVNITLDAGPPELPGTTNVVIEVVEPSLPISGNAGVYSKPEAFTAYKIQRSRDDRIRYLPELSRGSDSVGLDDQQLRTRPPSTLEWAAPAVRSTRRAPAQRCVVRVCANNSRPDAKFRPVRVTGRSTGGSRRPAGTARRAARLAPGDGRVFARLEIGGQLDSLQATA